MLSKLELFSIVVCTFGELEVIAKRFKTKQCKSCVEKNLKWITTILLFAAGFKFPANFYANGLYQLQMAYTDVHVML